MPDDASRCPGCGAPRVGEILGTRFSTGEVIDDRYEVVGRISEGGMGELYKVRHMHLHDIRAIKILRPGRLGDETSRQRFLREARIAASIKHPNVALLHDFAMLPDKSWYMVEEFIEGATLARSIRSGRRFSLNEVVEIAKQILLGLGAIHDGGIVHRDISPDNVMLAESPGGAIRVKIIDLGIARPIDVTEAHSITSAGLFIGKPRYASPEQMRLLEDDDAPIDHRTDLYSLGVVLYEVVSGNVPSESSTPFNLLLMQLAGQPFTIDRAVADLMPPDLEAFIVRLLRARPEQRFQSTIEALRALSKIRVGAPTLDQASSAGPGEPAHASSATTPRRSQTAEVPVEQLKRLIEQDRPDSVREPANPSVVAEALPADAAPDEDDLDDSRKITLLQTAVPKPVTSGPEPATPADEPSSQRSDDADPVAFVPEIALESQQFGDVHQPQDELSAEMSPAPRRRAQNPLAWFIAGIAFVAVVSIGGYLFYRWLDAKFGGSGETVAPASAAPARPDRIDEPGGVGADGTAARPSPSEPLAPRTETAAAKPAPADPPREVPVAIPPPRPKRSPEASTTAPGPAETSDTDTPDTLDAPDQEIEAQVAAPVDDARQGDVVAPGPGVVVPTVVRAVEPIYPPLSANMGKEGTAMFSVLVAPDGSVEVVKLIVSSGSAPLDRSAEDAAWRTVFTPATKDGVKVRMWRTLRFEFRKTRGF